MILTCGEDTVPAPHLAVRTLWLRLPTLDPDHRRLDQQVQQQWQQVRPRVFAALLDLLATVLKELPNVSLRRYRRRAA